MKLRAKILQTGKTACGIEVPATVVAGLGPSRKPAVKVTINGYAYRSSIASMGGKFMLGVSAEVRERSGVKGGDTIDVDLELDTEPREVTIPADFQTALDLDPSATRFFGTLSYSNKRRLVEPIGAIKNPETRHGRIARTVEMLREGRV